MGTLSESTNQSFNGSGQKRPRPILPTVLVILALSVCPVLADPVNLLVNGGFETGDLTGWNATANVIVAGAFGGLLPNSGSFMAVMSPGGQLDAQLGQMVDLSGFDPTTSLTFSFAFRLFALDTTLIEFSGQDGLLIGFGGILNFVPFDDLFNIPPQFPSFTGWIPVEVTVPLNLLDADPLLSIGFQTVNQESGQSFTGLIDDVSVTTPEPGSLALVSIGLLGLTLLRVRRD